MSKASEVIVLCEDKLHDVFICRLLKQWGLRKGREIRVVHYPAEGSGSGEQHVRNTYAKELKAYRRRAAKAKTILIAVVDADAGSVRGHHSELSDACRDATPAIPPRADGEAVMHVIPKYHIETWLAYLDGQSVDEDTPYKNTHGFKNRESDCRGLVDRLASDCKNRRSLNSPPASLVLACEEFARIRGDL